MGFGAAAASPEEEEGGRVPPLDALYGGGLRGGRQDMPYPGLRGLLTERRVSAWETRGGAPPPTPFCIFASVFYLRGGLSAHAQLLYLPPPHSRCPPPSRVLLSPIEARWVGPTPRLDVPGRAREPALLPALRQGRGVALGQRAARHAPGPRPHRLPAAALGGWAAGAAAAAPARGPGGADVAGALAALDRVSRGSRGGVARPATGRAAARGHRRPREPPERVARPVREGEQPVCARLRAVPEEWGHADVPVGSLCVAAIERLLGLRPSASMYTRAITSAAPGKGSVASALNIISPCMKELATSTGRYACKIMRAHHVRVHTLHWHAPYIHIYVYYRPRICAHECAHN